MKYFLIKTEPKEYSIEKFIKDKVTVWDGVRNAEAIRTLKSMKKGDRVFIYHSGGQNTIRGLAKVVSLPKPDPKLPSSWVVELGLEEVFGLPYVSLIDIREAGKFGSLPLLRQPRLSVVWLPESFVRWFATRYKANA
jgi:hypothetical protein